jgi:ParB family chromosome partitioning protein
MRSELSPAQEFAGDLSAQGDLRGIASGDETRWRPQERSSRKFCDSIYVRDSERTGKSERAVQLAAARGKALGDDLKDVEGTSLDKGVELDALAKMPAAERKEVIAKAKAGEKVSALLVEQGLALFRQMSSEQRDRFVAAVIAEWK